MQPASEFKLLHTRTLNREGCGSSSGKVLAFFLNLLTDVLTKAPRKSPRNRPSVDPSGPVLLLGLCLRHSSEKPFKI